MTEQTLMLLDRATRVPGVLQAFLVTRDRVVYSAACRGQALTDDQTWLTVADTIDGLARYLIEADTIRWSFGETTLILQKGVDACIFGAVVKPLDLEVTTGKLRRRFRDFQIKLQAEVLKTELTDAFKESPEALATAAPPPTVHTASTADQNALPSTEEPAESLEILAADPAVSSLESTPNSLPQTQPQSPPAPGAPTIDLPQIPQAPGDHESK